jgi:hypothetical protein
MVGDGDQPSDAARRLNAEAVPFVVRSSPSFALGDASGCVIAPPRAKKRQLLVKMWRVPRTRPR